MSLVDTFHAAHKTRIARIDAAARWREDPPINAEPFYRGMWFHHLVNQTDDPPIPVYRPIRIVDIQKAVCRKWKVSRLDMISGRRTKDIVMPRHVAMYLARKITPHSIPEIGRRFGGRDHTTVLFAIAKIDRLKGVDEDLAGKIRDIRLELPA
jgi:hypothetical protein